MNTLYVSTSCGLYAFSTENIDADGVAGEVKWVYPTDLPLGHSPTIHEGIAYVGGMDHRVHAIDADPDLATLPVDPETGLRLNDHVVWTFEAGAGFQTTPLVIDNSVDPGVPAGEGKLYVGNRDGRMYAIHIEGPEVGQLAWSSPFETGGPILFSAAYKDGVIFFASNDSRAYALNAADGDLVWASSRLPGVGFHSWWPVVYTDPDTQVDYVVFSGSSNYRLWVEPGPLQDIEGLEPYDLFVTNGIPHGDTIGPVDLDDLMDVTLVLQYYEEKPWRRTVFVLNAATGAELVFDYQREDGTIGESFSPITWQGANGPGNRYPAIVGSDDLLYQPIDYVSRSDIARGGIVGWKPGTAEVRITGPLGAIDEPIAYAAGGNLIYWVRNSDRMAGAFDRTLRLSEPDRSWVYFVYNLATLIPGYNEMYSPPCYPDYSVYSGAFGSDNGIYGRHGDQNPPIPYDGKVYIHQSNAIIAFAPSDDSPVALTAVPAVNISDSFVTPLSTADLVGQLSEEVQLILDAGHLRPGYLGSGNFDLRSRSAAGEYLLDYWHHPSDTLYTLLLALPYLSSTQRQSVELYLQNEFTSFPPNEYVHIGWSIGAAREVFDLPPEVESDRVNFPATSFYDGFYSGWHFPPHMFYALWKYALVFGDASGILDSSGHLLEPAPADEYLAENPHVHNAYIAGYLGYLELEKLAGREESSSKRGEYDRLLDLRARNFAKDSPFACDDYRRVLNVSRNFMFLVPELGEYLHSHALQKVQEAIEEYEYVAPYWFATKTEQTFYEGIIQPLYDSSALFLARAFILGDSREKLLKYLDVPAFERGDLFHIQKLVAAIEAHPYLEKTVVPDVANQGDSVTYTLSLVGSGSAVSLTDTLPAGIGEPFGYELEGTAIEPTYDSEQRTLTWIDTPATGQVVAMTYHVDITTDEPTWLVNSVELRDDGGRLASGSARVIANPYLFMLPVVFQAGLP